MEAVCAVNSIGSCHYMLIYGHTRSSSEVITHVKTVTVVDLMPLVVFSAMA